MIEIKNITKIYNKGKANAFMALEDISMEIVDGEMTAVMGKSGAGKSTLLHILACIDSYEDGEYRIDGLLIKGLPERRLARIRNDKIGLIMQDFALCNDYTCIENVILPLRFRKGNTREKKKNALEALKSVGLGKLANKLVKNLSGGQKQRVAIARTIAQNPSVILADEPTGALDSKTAADIMGLFKKLNEEGKTIVIVTHDKAVAQQCGRIIEISDGRIGA